MEPLTRRCVPGENDPANEKLANSDAEVYRIMEAFGVHRPRNVDWKRAGALLYGDWGTSKAYVIGFAFSTGVGALGFKSLPIIIGVMVLTALVAYNYVLVCKNFPDGGGVYSAARDQSRFLAVLGALLLVANFTVTAAMSCWAAMGYFRVPKELIAFATVGVIFLVGILNFFGPKHSGSVAISLAMPMVVVIGATIVFSVPHLTVERLQPLDVPFQDAWIAFTGMILALSGVEAIANLTGVMKLDPNSTTEEPSVERTAKRSIWFVALEVVVGTTLLGWAMLSLPHDMTPLLKERWEDMLSVLGEHYGGLALGTEFGMAFGIVVGVVVGLLLLSAVNTSIAALIGLNYMLARDGEMPRQFAKLNRFGVPLIPLLVATGLPIIVAALARDLETLMGLYAIGVVGAIAVNLGSCTFNRNLKLKLHERFIMGFTFLVLVAVELTIAKTKDDALFFAICVLMIGFGLRTYVQRRAGLRTVTVHADIAARVAPETLPDFRLNLTAGQAVLVAARGITPVLRYALEEARLREGRLYVLYVKELAVTLPARFTGTENPRWQDDPIAAEIMYTMLHKGKEVGVPVIPLYVVSEAPAGTILDLAATLGIDILMLGAPHRHTLVSLLKGNVVTEVARNLPENIQLVIHS